MKTVVIMLGVGGKEYHRLLASEVFKHSSVSDIVSSLDVVELISTLKTSFEQGQETCVVDGQHLSFKQRRRLYRELHEECENLNIVAKTIFESFRSVVEYRTDDLMSGSVTMKDLKVTYASFTLPKLNLDCDEVEYVDLESEKYVKAQFDSVKLLDLDVNAKSAVEHLIKRVSSTSHPLSNELMYVFDEHDNPHHIETIAQHIQFAVDLANDEFDVDRELMMCISLFHDLAKGFVKSMKINSEGDLVAMFKYHELLGETYARRLLSHFQPFSRKLTNSEIDDICQVIRHHMSFVNPSMNVYKYDRKYAITSRQRELLEKFRKIDLLARKSMIEL